jgi:hypothetical protein
VTPSSLPARSARFPIQRDDVLMMESSGGGGFGDPLVRESRRGRLGRGREGYVHARGAARRLRRRAGRERAGRRRHAGGARELAAGAGACGSTRRLDSMARAGARCGSTPPARSARRRRRRRGELGRIRAGAPLRAW